MATLIRQYSQMTVKLQELAIKLSWGLYTYIGSVCFDFSVVEYIVDGYEYYDH